jgi:hypothetical protein
LFLFDMGQTEAPFTLLQDSTNESLSRLLIPASLILPMRAFAAGAIAVDDQAAA